MKFLLKEIWKHKCLPPRILMFTWRCIVGVIPVGKVLNHRMPHIDPTCPMCDSADETLSHLLFQCPYAKSAWFGSFLGLVNMEEEARSYVDTVKAWLNCEDDDHEKFKFGAILMWNIWKARNKKVFERLDTPPSRVIHMATAQYQVLRNAFSGAIIQNDENQFTSQPMKKVKWNPPPSEKLKLNVDGATSHTRADGACIIRDHNGSLFAAKCFTTRAMEAETIEMLVIREGLLWLKELKISGATLEGDAEKLIRILRSDSETPPW